MSKPAATACSTATASFSVFLRTDLNSNCVIATQDYWLERLQSWASPQHPLHWRTRLWNTQCTGSSNYSYRVYALFSTGPIQCQEVAMLLDNSMVILIVLSSKKIWYSSFSSTETLPYYCRFDSLHLSEAHAFVLGQVLSLSTSIWNCLLHPPHAPTLAHLLKNIL